MNLDDIDYDGLNGAVPASRRQGYGGQAPRRKAKAPMARSKAPMREAERRTQLKPEAPAPRFEAVLASRGPELTKAALEAWQARIEGVPIIDVAHQLNVSIELAKKLIGEVHTAIRDDLKDNLDLNRQLDLERMDGLVNTFYPQAREGDVDSAAVVIRALQHRAKLTGIEPMPDPGRSHPTNVLVWIQNQMPNINKLVDSLPLELPPAAPGSV